MGWMRLIGWDWRWVIFVKIKEQVVWQTSVKYKDYFILQVENLLANEVCVSDTKCNGSLHVDLCIQPTGKR